MFWDRFIALYKEECEKHALPVILEAFYVYMGCTGQFAVKEVWRKYKY